MTVTPYHYVLHIYKGARLSTPLVFELDGVPQDFTGKAARCQFRRTIDSAVVFSITPTVDSVGTVTFVMTAVETAEIDSDETEYEIFEGQVEIYDPADEDVVDRYINVTAIVWPEITR